MVLSFGCILDPHFKFGFFRFCYSKFGLDSMAIEAKLKIVKHKLYTLHNEYVKLYSEKKKNTHTHTHTQLAMLLQVKVHYKGLHLLVLLLVESHQHQSGLL